MTRASFESIVTRVPGPRSRELVPRSRACEARGVTYLGDDYPGLLGARARARSIDRRRRQPVHRSHLRVRRRDDRPHEPGASRAPSPSRRSGLIHGMGDVHPTEVQVRLLEAARRARARASCARRYLCDGGAEAVEFALKTALLATGKPHAIAYRGALSRALARHARGRRESTKFRAPFAPLVAERATFLPYPGARDASLARRDRRGARRARARSASIGAIVVEPIQGRGGVIVPPDGFLRGAARALRRARRCCWSLDEIYTGLRPHRDDVRVRTRRRRPRHAVRRQGARPAAFRSRPTIGTRARDGCLGAAAPAKRCTPRRISGNPLALRGGARESRRDRAARHLRASRATRGRARRAACTACAPHAGVRRRARARDACGRSSSPTPRSRTGVVVRALARGLILLQVGTDAATSITFAPPLSIDDAQLARALELFERGRRGTGDGMSDEQVAGRDRRSGLRRRRARAGVRAAPRASRWSRIASPSSAAARRARAQDPARVRARSTRCSAGVELDVVSVASPPFDHHRSVLAALAAGKHVLCEKPFALDVAQAEEMDAARERAGTVCALAFEFRYVAARHRDQGADRQRSRRRAARDRDRAAERRRCSSASTDRPRGWWFDARARRRRRERRHAALLRSGDVARRARAARDARSAAHREPAAAATRRGTFDERRRRRRVRATSTTATA